MKILSKKNVLNFFKEHKETNLFGRWIRLKDITPLIEKFTPNFEVHQIGESEQKRPIFSIKFGNGKRKILIWTQMHGNESTGTKAVFDFLNLVNTNTQSCIAEILKECTILCIPILNPDGSEKYTRVNGNKIDLNRDAVNTSQIESKILRTVLKEFNPQFCFNLHDQRTIFGVEGTKNPATLSFLAPSEDETRNLTEGRKQTMNVIIAMNSLLQQIIPNHIGRYSDEFYPTATGDNFQKLGHNCILIESGHFYDDYVREKSRAFTFCALLQGVYHIATATSFNQFEPYFNIPNNVELFLDVVNRDSKKIKAYQYTYQIIDGKFISNLAVEEEFDENQVIGHNEIVFDGELNLN